MIYLPNDIFAWQEWAILVVDTIGNACSSVLVRDFDQKVKVMVIVLLRLIDMLHIYQPFLLVNINEESISMLSFAYCGSHAEGIWIYPTLTRLYCTANSADSK